MAWQQAPSGDHFVFDRRDHSVYRVPRGARTPAKIVSIGGEGGRLLEPTAFDLAPDGRTFAVADAPRGQERLQVFDANGTWVAGFFLPGRAHTRVSVNGLALGGVATLAFLGNGIVLNQPETGSLITEYGLKGTPVRSIGTLRATGHEADRQLHLAMNTGIPLRLPDGGYYFVFLSGTPVFRRYDARGGLLFERAIQGRELDPIIAEMPTRWPRRTVNGTELPLVVPTVRTAAVDPGGRLWVTFLTPFTYVFDEHGDKIRTVQFRAAGVIAPRSLSFSTSGRVFVTPGCYEFPGVPSTAKPSPSVAQLPPSVEGDRAGPAFGYNRLSRDDWQARHGTPRPGGGGSPLHRVRGGVFVAYRADAAADDADHAHAAESAAALHHLSGRAERGVVGRSPRCGDVSGSDRDGRARRARERGAVLVHPCFGIAVCRRDDPGSLHGHCGR